MSKSNESKFGDYFKLPNPGLRSYFDTVRTGQPEEYRSTFAKGENVQDVLDAWAPTLESGIADKYPTLLEFENDLKAKVGPMSIMKPLDERIEDIDHYYDDILLSSEAIDERAVKAVLAEYAPLRGLRPRSKDKTLNRMKLSTNSGSPYFTKRRHVVNDTLPFKIVRNGNHIVQQLSGGVYNACAVLGWRGQEGGPSADDVKQRVVWMFPFAVNIAELQVYQPLIEAAQRFNLEPSWVSMDAVDERITHMFDTKGVDDLVICTDFSKFDQHFNADMQKCANQILRALLDNSDASRSWIEEVFPIKYSIPLAYDYGKIRYGYHGMGSGSGGTNADETLAHRALQYEAAQAKHQKLNPNSQCLGDDGVLTYPGITVEDVVHSYTRHGLEMNADKQYASKHDCTYLRRWHSMSYRLNGVCVGVYSTYRALGRLMEQERYFDPDIWSKEAVALRQLSILENVKYHPLRGQFVEFCMKRDKYRLGIDIPNFLDNVEEISKKYTAVMPDFLGYTKTQMRDSESGIKSWWVVKYLKSIR
nr:MAG: RNA-dependent RNA polymerase [Porcine picobirnavirus]